MQVKTFKFGSIITGAVHNRGSILVLISVLIITASTIIVSFPATADVWERVDQGLFVGEFRSPKKSVLGNPTIIIIKIDPGQFTFKLLCAKERGLKGMTLKDWCRRFGLIGGVNAGMYQTDGLSNVGYMKNFTFVNNPRIASKFLSVFAFNPVKEGIVQAKIFDIDEEDMEDVIKNYNTIVQNLRLIKRSGENRWAKQPKIWSEVALGEDRDGNILFIYSPTPCSMHEFNNILLLLPVGIECAQHLEGGAEASIYLKYKDYEIEKYGSHKENLSGADYIQGAAYIPNVIGFSK